METRRLEIGALRAVDVVADQPHFRAHRREVRGRTAGREKPAAVQEGEQRERFEAEVLCVRKGETGKPG